MMRSMLVVGCAVLLASAERNVRADEPKAEQIIEKAIRAHGGQDRLKGLSGFTYKTRTVYEKGPTWSYEYAFEAPLRYRSCVGTGAEGKIASIVVVDGNQGWLKSGAAETTAYPPTFLDTMKKFTIPYLGPRSMLRLLDRQKNRQCHFSTVAECTIDGHQAVGVRMKLQDGPQETWYFDKETGLLLKEESSTRRFESEDILYTTTYEDYKTFDGFPMARKIASYQDGKLTSTRELIEFKVGTPDPAAFAKP
jgi:hypothetical protein